MMGMYDSYLRDDVDKRVGDGRQEFYPFRGRRWSDQGYI